jgi:hypothetical protein
VVEQHHPHLHAEEEPCLPLPPHGLYCRAAAGLQVRLHAAADGAAGEVAAHNALHRDGGVDDSEHVTQTTAHSVAAPVALGGSQMLRKQYRKSVAFHLQARGAHVEDALCKHVAHPVAAGVPPPHALQAGSVRVRLGFALRRQRHEASDHVPAPPPLQDERREPAAQHLNELSLF